MYPFYRVKKVDFTKINKRKAWSVWDKNPGKFSQFLDKANNPYIHWEKLKFKTPFDGLEPEESWFLIRNIRNLVSRDSYLKADSKNNFKWMRPPNLDQWLHEIDMYTGGKITTQAQALEGDSSKLIVRGRIEEAIASSQLEGAHTTRAAAKKLLSEGLKAKDNSEQMILNNYRAIVMIDEEYKNKDLSLDLIFEIHRVLTELTLDKEEQGRLRTNKDKIVVDGNIGSETYTTHIPPDEKFLQKEIQRLIDFANDKDEETFLHPVIKAIFLHFWIGYLHPFTDGNGRLARSLFYWYLLKKGYWMMMYLPISTIIKKTPAQYAMAYIYTEQDNFDLTYFFDFHIRKIIDAIKDFEEYLEKKIRENKHLDEILETETIINERQKSLLYYLLEDKHASATMSSHAELNNITRQTAAKDLKSLEEAGFVFSRREGKHVRYYAAQKLKELKS